MGFFNSGVDTIRNGKFGKTGRPMKKPEIQTTSLDKLIDRIISVRNTYGGELKNVGVFPCPECGAWMRPLFWKLEGLVFRCRHRSKHSTGNVIYFEAKFDGEIDIWDREN